MGEDEICNDTEVLDEEPRSILMGLISQLRKGMDLHRVTLPTFVLEPRSMLERITDFMSHPELILRYVLCKILVDWWIRIRTLFFFTKIKLYSRVLYGSPGDISRSYSFEYTAYLNFYSVFKKKLFHKY